MNQAIIVLDKEAELELPVVLIAEPESERSRLTVPLLLAAGWGALFTFSVAFLMDEGKIDTASMAGESAALLEVANEPARMEASRIPPQIAETVHPAEVVVADLPSTGDDGPDAADDASTARSAALPEPASRYDARTESRAEPAAVERPGFVGTWGPHPRACGARANRKGYLPATITENGAKAGRTHCRFRHPRRDGPAWTTMADCSDGSQRWTSQVRLTVNGDRLNWSSEKGPAIYVRCGRREG